MNSTTPIDGRREQAIALRRAGKSRRQIKEILGVGSNATLNELLASEPPPEWTRRPNAKDDLHAKGPELARAGLRLQPDRRRTGRLERHRLGLGPRHALAGAPQLRGVPQACS